MEFVSESRNGPRRTGDHVHSSHSPAKKDLVFVHWSKMSLIPRRDMVKQYWPCTLTIRDRGCEFWVLDLGVFRGPSCMKNYNDHLSLHYWKGGCRKCQANSHTQSLHYILIQRPLQSKTTNKNIIDWHFAKISDMEKQWKTNCHDAMVIICGHCKGLHIKSRRMQSEVNTTQPARR